MIYATHLCRSLDDILDGSDPLDAMLVAECREMIAERDELVDASVTSLGDDWHRVTPS